jgi:SRSO17 transposase
VGLAKRPVGADAGYGDVTGFRLGLAERGLCYAVAVKGSTTAYLAGAVPQLLAYTPGRGRRRAAGFG